MRSRSRTTNVRWLIPWTAIVSLTRSREPKRGFVRPLPPKRGFTNRRHTVSKCAHSENSGTVSEYRLGMARSWRNPVGPLGVATRPSPPRRSGAVSEPLEAREQRRQAGVVAETVEPRYRFKRQSLAASITAARIETVREFRRRRPWRVAQRLRYCCGSSTTLRPTYVGLAMTVEDRVAAPSGVRRPCPTGAAG